MHFAGGAYDSPPDLLVGSGGTPLPDPTPLRAFGASIIAPLAHRISRSILTFPLLLIYEMTTDKGLPPPTILLLKNKLSDLSYGIKFWTDFTSVLLQCTRLRQTDRRTDGQSYHR